MHNRRGFLGRVAGLLGVGLAAPATLAELASKEVEERPLHKHPVNPAPPADLGHNYIIDGVPCSGVFLCSGTLPYQDYEM